MIDVTFDRVSKRYRVYGPAASGGARFSRLGGLARPARDFWAVRDVSFEVAHAETLGVIGRNGAGKSTLLRLLSRITAPTAGEITLNGRVAALIEVGSGFHPELTGRENVFLSGSILGMRRREIASKLDRIVEFSGVGTFIDTPVKWYSSGMYVRLGFSIAAHMEADILLVDEVLAVGDAAFQIQCYERLNELRRAGTTMLFISHDLTSIERLCDRVVLMDAGRLVAAGSPHDVIHSYQAAVQARAAAMADASETPDADGAAAVEAVTFHDGSGAEVFSASTGNPLLTRVHYHTREAVADAVVEVFYYSRDGRTLQCQQSTAINGGALALEPGPGVVEFVTPELGLQPGVYAIGATIRTRRGAETIDWFYGQTSLFVEQGKAVRGYFYTPHAWRLVATQDAAAARSSGSFRDSSADAAHG